MLSIEETPGKKVLHVLDPDLALLASEAAIDIDNLLSNRSKDLKAMRDLAGRLKNSVEVSAGGPPHSLMDPATLTVLGEAVAQAAGMTYAQKIEDLKAILFKRVNEESAKAIGQRRREEEERKQEEEQEAMADKQEREQEKGAFIATPTGKAKRGSSQRQVKQNTQVETRGGKSQF